METPYKRKLIEVALPLEAINRESAREKSIRHGHPSTLHLWWARRPLAAARAVLFAQLVDDPSSRPDEFPTPEAQEKERKRLFDLIERLVPWEATRDEKVLAEAREEIRKSCGGEPPPILDPFCGGGTIPLEAQRLGLEAHASDLNPVAVLITKALIEIPPKFANMPPVNPGDRESRIEGGWKGAEGLAADVRYYGRWMRDEAEKRIGHLYPKAKLPDGSEATVIAWIWARTVTCPNPACGATMPLISSLWLGKKKGKERWLRPVVEGREVRFVIGTGPGGPSDPPKQGRGARFRCLVCGEVAPEAHVKAEGMAGRMGAQLLATVAEGNRGRTYLPATEEHIKAANVARPPDVPEEELPTNPRWFSPPAFGMTRYADLFTNRQLVTLTKLADLISEVRGLVTGNSTQFYADAICHFLGLAFSRTADLNNSIVTWSSSRDQARNLFARQAIPMSWDFTEVSPFARAAGDLGISVDTAGEVIKSLPASALCFANQADAAGTAYLSSVASTDPPYYDNIGYADLSDFFYVWLRRCLQNVHPNVLTTVLVPKSEELVATPYRFNEDRKAARTHFEDGFNRAFANVRAAHRNKFPLTIFYAFRQAESDGDGVVASTGWETMLEGLLGTKFSVTGTWPMRTERTGRSIGIGTNALASSIVLVCRPRREDAGVTDKRGFVSALRRRLPDALREMQQGAVAPVDMAQAAIGPGMAAFSSYAKVLEPDGSPMRVRTALGLINQVLDEVLAEQEGEFDSQTRWAMKWFEQYAYNDAEYGRAETLATAHAVSISGMEKAGILRAKAGKVALLGHEDMPDDWDPVTDATVTAWEVVHQLIRRLDEGGEDTAGTLLRQVGGLGEIARDLAYRLYNICERKKWATSGRAFNGLVTSWREIEHAARNTADAREPAYEQGTLQDEK